MVKKISFIAIIFLLLLLAVIIFSYSPFSVYAEEPMTYYIDIESFNYSLGAGTIEFPFNLFGYTDEYNNRIFLKLFYLYDLGIADDGFALCFPEECLFFYSTYEFEVETGSGSSILVPKGWNPEFVDFSTGEILIDYPIDWFSEFISTEPFEFNGTLPDLVPDSDNLALSKDFVNSLFSGFSSFIKNFGTVLGSIVELIYVDGIFTDLGIVFIGIISVSIGFILLNFLIKLWSF